MGLGYHYGPQCPLSLTSRRETCLQHKCFDGLVHTREGYYATNDIPEDNSADQSLAEAVKNPIPYAGISVRPEIVKLSSKPASAQVTLGIDRRGLSGEVIPDGRRHSELTAIRAEFSAKGEVLDYRAVQKDVFIDKGTDEQFERSLNSPIRFTLSTQGPEKATRIRFVIRDTASGRIGTADLDLKRSAEEPPSQLPRAFPALSGSIDPKHHWPDR